MQKIPERKKRKRERRSKDRRSHSRRKKDYAEQSQEDHLLILEIIKLIPRKRQDDLNDKFTCPDCKKSFCRNFHYDIEYCNACYWGVRNACGKAIKGIKYCDNCDERRKNNEKITGTAPAWRETLSSLRANNV